MMHIFLYPQTGAGVQTHVQQDMVDTWCHQKFWPLFFGEKYEIRSVTRRIALYFRSYMLVFIQSLL